MDLWIIKLVDRPDVFFPEFLSKTMFVMVVIDFLQILKLFVDFACYDMICTDPYVSVKARP